MDNHAVPGAGAFLEQPAQRVASRIAKVPFPQKRIAEGQSDRDSIFPRQRKRRLRIAYFRPDAATAPDAIRRSAIEGADLTPVVEVLPMLAKQRQKDAVQLIELKQAGKMVIGDTLLRLRQVGGSGHFNHLIHKWFATMLAS